MHVLLAVFYGWVPVVPAVTLAAAPEDTVLRFSFAQSPDATAEQPVTPRGEVPFETPAPRPAADLSPPPRDPGQPLPPQAAPPEPQGDPARRDERAPTESAEPTKSSTGVETLPEHADAALRRDPSPSPEGTSQQDFDLRGAIQDFGRALDEARKASPPAPRQGSGPPRNVFVPDPVELPATGFGVGNLTFETRDFDWTDYARSIYWEIWRAWHNRLLRLASDFERWSYDNREPNLYHQAAIRFVIERSGEVTGIVVETPSGCIPLDHSATQALEEVILPALPDAFPQQREVVHARFVAQGEIRALRPHLERLKYLNYF